MHSSRHCFHLTNFINSNIKTQRKLCHISTEREGSKSLKYYNIKVPRTCHGRNDNGLPATAGLGTQTKVCFDDPPGLRHAYGVHTLEETQSRPGETGDTHSISV